MKSKTPQFHPDDTKILKKKKGHSFQTTTAPMIIQNRIQKEKRKTEKVAIFIFKKRIKHQEN